MSRCGGDGLCSWRDERSGVKQIFTLSLPHSFNKCFGWMSVFLRESHDNASFDQGNN